MDTNLLKNWWLLLINAIAAMIFGLLAIFLKDITLILLINYFGILATFEGMFFMMGGFSNKGKTPLWRFWIFEGLLNIIIGITILSGRDHSLVFFVTLVAIWAITTGITQLVSAYQLINIPKKWLYFFNGAISVIFGLLILVKPLNVSILAIVLGFYALITGIFSFMVSMIMKKIYVDQKKSTTETFTINRED